MLFRRLFGDEFELRRRPLRVLLRMLQHLLPSPGEVGEVQPECDIFRRLAEQRGQFFDGQFIGFEPVELFDLLRQRQVRPVEILAERNHVEIEVAFGGIKAIFSWSEFHPSELLKRAKPPPPGQQPIVSGFKFGQYDRLDQPDRGDVRGQFFDAGHGAIFGAFDGGKSDVFHFHCPFDYTFVWNYLPDIAQKMTHPRAIMQSVVSVISCPEAGC